MTHESPEVDFARALIEEVLRTAFSLGSVYAPPLAARFSEVGHSEVLL